MSHTPSSPSSARRLRAESSRTRAIVAWQKPREEMPGQQRWTADPSSEYTDRQTDAPREGWAGGQQHRQTTGPSHLKEAGPRGRPGRARDGGKGGSPDRGRVLLI